MGLLFTKYQAGELRPKVFQVVIERIVTYLDEGNDSIASGPDEDPISTVEEIYGPEYWFVRTYTKYNRWNGSPKTKEVKRRRMTRHEIEENKGKIEGE